MNLIAVLISFLVKIKSDNSKIEVQKVHLLENNFWNPANRRVEIGEGFLYSFQFADERKKVLHSEFKADNCFYLDCNSNNSYVELPGYLTKKILSCLNSLKVDKNFIRVRFYFTDRLIEEDNRFSNYKGKKVYYDTHMWVEKSLNNDGFINLKFDEDKSRAVDIKEKFKQLMGERLYKLVNRDNFFISFKELEKTKDFDLRISKSYRECYKDLKSFAKNIQFFGLTENDKNEENVNKTIMSPSKFMQRIDEMIEKDLERLSGDFEKSKFDKFCLNFVHFFHESKNVLRKKASLETYKSLLERCFDDLKCRMQEKKIFFLIGGKYTDDFYFNELYTQVSRAVKEFQEEYEVANFEDRKVIFQEICGLFYDGLINLQIKANNELFESDFIHEQFSKLFGNDVNTSNDILKIEKIIIDYLNMLTYSSRILKISGQSHLNFYCGPLHFNYGYKCKIVSYLKIKLETSFSNDFKKIEAFNEKGEKVEFERNVHFYLNYHLNCEFYCENEVLKKLNIKKIKITTLNEDLCKMVEVDKYLSD